MKFLKPINRSIRSQTLVYFMVLVLVMISLLWVLQEWFFSKQFLRLKQQEIVKTVDEYTLDFDYSIEDAHAKFMANLYGISVKNNLMIYCFTFSGTISENQAKTDEKGRPLKSLSGTKPMGRVLNPFLSEDAATAQNAHLDWSQETESNFLYILESEKNFEYNSAKNKLYYAVECPSTTSYRYFVYMEAALSNKDITMDIYRFILLLITIICLILALVFALLLSQLLANPITKISKQAAVFASGELETRFDKSPVKEISDLSDGLNYAVDEFKKTEQLRRDFMANVSHDLRTPLTMVRGYAEILRDKPVTEAKRQKYAQNIIGEAERLSRLVDDIQRLSRIQSGTEEMRETVFNLDAFLKGVIEQFNMINKSLGFSIGYSGEGAVNVSGDKEKITQVMHNLISNAVNYTDKDQKLIEVRLQKTKNKALVEVIDNGKGIAPEDIDAVWERYYRVNQQKREVVGSGLGLSIVKGILTAHKSEFGVKSELGKGTTFWFKLNIKQ